MSSRSCANRAGSSDKNALDASIMQIAIGALATKHLPSLSRMYTVACATESLIGAVQRASAKISWKLSRASPRLLLDRMAAT